MSDVREPSEPVAASADVPAAAWWALALTVGFAVFYWLWAESFAVVPGPLDRYIAERSAALETGALVSDAMLLELAADPLAIRAGERTFAATCARCHGEGGKGGVGPNLTDDVWLGGGSPLEIYTTITVGRARQGMPAWGGELGRATCKQLAAYLVSRRPRPAGVR